MKNREIKFRAWNHKSKQMYDNVCIDMYGHASNGVSFLTYDKEKDAVMQFTGFKDTNGKEIYEGDILRIEKTDGETYKAQVRFFNGAFCIYTNNQDAKIKSEKGYNVLIHIDYEWKEYRPFFKVIGNIYETPELLSK